MILPSAMIAIDTDVITYRHIMSRASQIPNEWGDVFGPCPWPTPFSEYQRIRAGYPKTLYPSDGKTINTYLPVELLKEIILYSIEMDHMASGHLASVCRYWRSVVTCIASLWSTLRVGPWTDVARFSTWLQRAYPKKVVIDGQISVRELFPPPPFAALHGALTSTDQWNELTISSFPPEYLINQYDFSVAAPMKALKVLHVGIECLHSPSLVRLFQAVSMEAPLSELQLPSSFASAHFLRPQCLPVLQNLRVLISNGKELYEPIQLLPAFTQLQILEADHLLLPLCAPNTNLPLLSTLQRLKLRACSVEWMAGREFSCLEECVILLPRHWHAVQQHAVQLPSCRRLTYYHYPMTTVQYFHAPKMEELRLGSNDCIQQRVYRCLKHLCISYVTILQLTTLHLTLQRGGNGLFNFLQYMAPLRVLVLSIAYPSSSWERFLRSLAAKPSTKPEWNLWDRV